MLFRSWEASTPEHFEGLKFLDPEEALSATLKELEGKYDVLIGSFHLGREDEKGGVGIMEAAKKFPQFDIIFAGHEHAVYNTDVNGVKNNRTWSLRSLRGKRSCNL